MSQAPGVAAPPKPAEQEIGDDIMSAATHRLGLNFPRSAPSAAKPAAPAAPAPAEDDDDNGAAATPGDAVESDPDHGETDTPPAKPTAEAGDEGETDPEAKDGADKAEPTAEEQAALELAKENAAYVDANLKTLPAPLKKQVQAVLDARIGKITATSKAEQARLEARVEELTAEVEAAQGKAGAPAPVALPGVHPLMFAESTAVLDARLAEIEAFEDFAAEHADGYEGDEAKGLPAWTPEQLRKQVRELHRERDRVIPAARAKLVQRATADAALKQTFAPLFDRKSAEYAQAQAILKTMPELRRHPNASEIVAKIILGERALAALGKPKPAAPTPAAVRRAPRVPGAGGAPRGSAIPRAAGGAGATEAGRKFAQSPTRATLRSVALSLLDESEPGE
jgi:hypothetical protein